jgi:hypothetical protein
MSTAPPANGNGEDLVPLNVHGGDLKSMLIVVQTVMVRPLHACTRGPPVPLTAVCPRRL